MGEVIKPLAHGEAPKHTIFDRRFVIVNAEGAQPFIDELRSE